MDVSLGTNHFVDCDAIISIKGAPALKVTISPLRLTVATPADLPSGRLVRVIDNRPEPVGSSAVSPLVRVVASEKSVAVFWDQFLIAVATLLDDQTTVHLHVDLRPIGINVFDDASGLHVGGMHFTQATIANSATAFSLG